MKHPVSFARSRGINSRSKCFKYGLMIALSWLLVYIYTSYTKENFKTDQFHFDMIKQKFGDLMQNNFIARHFEPATEYDWEKTFETLSDEYDDNGEMNYDDDVERNEKLADERETESYSESDSEETEEENDDYFELDDGRTDEAFDFIKKYQLGEPGDAGRPVVIPKNISDDIRKKIDEGYQVNKFNSFASSLVSFNRELPDARNEECKKKVYDYEKLPKCSIILIFHNEEWSVFMRTLHSILIRTPLDLVEEILLVDDASDRDYLKKPLDDYIQNLPKVKIVRSMTRLGIISNRNFAAVNAKGPVLVNVDSHVEVMHGWLEPILDRFRISMNRLVWPKVMGISPDTLAINLDNKSIGAIGGFDWRMNFKWILDIDKHERLTNTSSEKWEPKKSVTTIGAVHAISKEFFMHLGMYDSGFGIWGGEDVELSLRVWMCGGEVEYVPCSSAFHMFKRTHSYEVTMKQYIVNTDRIAETWLDEYKRYYYRSVGDTKNRNYGNVSERVELRKKLGCKSFDWFIKNVYPDIEIPKEIRDTTMPPTKPPTKPPITMKTVEEAIVEFTQEPPTEEPTIEPTMRAVIRKVEATTVKKKIQNITKSQVNINNTMN